MTRQDLEAAGNPHRSGAGSAAALDFAKVLIVGRSNVTRVVVAKIIERSGLKPVSVSPDRAIPLLRDLMPGAVVLDGGEDNRECDGLMAEILSLRRANGGDAPVVVLLSNRHVGENGAGPGGTVDAVVAKPITPERLQTVMDRLLAQARN